MVDDVVEFSISLLIFCLVVLSTVDMPFYFMFNILSMFFISVIISPLTNGLFINVLKFSNVRKPVLFVFL